MKKLIIAGIAVVLLCAFAFATFNRRPHTSALPPLTADEVALRDRLRSNVTTLASDIGVRNTHRPANLERAAAFIEKTLQSLGHEVKRQSFDCDGQTVSNIEAEIRGSTKPDEIVIFGAHYDSVFGTPGANDNGSGSAALLEVARAARGEKFARTVRFVFFVNEEPPYFQGPQMGSLVYARRAKQRKEKIAGMLSIETIGYYCDAENCQQYPAPLSLLYPNVGNFLGFAANVASKSLLDRSLKAFRSGTSLPAEGGVAPESIPGVGWSDHWSFWQQGYPAIMLTDTAPYRYPYYHTAADTADKLDYDRFARATKGIIAIVHSLAN